MKTTILRQLCGLLLLLPAPAQGQGLIIPSGAYLIGNEGNIVLQNNWVNNGSFTHNGGTLIFAGTSQTLGGTASPTFNNLTIATGSTTTIVSSGQSLQGILVSNGTLNANGNLTLLSTAGQTASIDGSGAGQVLGNLTMQRYLPTGFGYKYFSSPFQSDTVGDFSDAINLTTTFPDFYRYDENQPTNGWINYTSPSGALVPLAGYAVNLGTSTAPLTVSLTGVVNNNTVSSPALFNHNLTYTQGFNLAGNPYPSPIDWNSPTGWTKTNIDDALYFFRAGTTDQYTGTYSSYINGVSSDGIAGNIIAAMQGFFIHVSNGAFPVSGQLIINNNARNTNPSVIFLDAGRRRIPSGPESPYNPGGPPYLFRLRAGFTDTDTLSDPVVLYLKDGATGAFDKKWDALKLMNTNPAVPSIYTISADTARLSIQAIPNTRDKLQVIPLGLTTDQDGWLTFHSDGLLQMPPSLHIYLADTRTGMNQDLGKSPRYRLYLTKGTYRSRFYLKFSPTALTDASSSPAPPAGERFDVYSSAGSLMIKSNLPSGAQAHFTVFDLAGRTLYREDITDNKYHTVSGPYLSAGIYIISLNDGHEIHSKKIFIGPTP